MSLRTRILLLIVFATLLPALLLAAYFVGERGRAIAVAERRLSARADFALRDLEAKSNAAAQLLYGLAHARELDTADRAACSLFLTRVAAEFPHYTGIATIATDGQSHCNSQLSPPTNLADRLYFRQALERTGTVFGVAIGRFSKVGVLQIALAARDSAGRPKFVLFTALDLRRFAQEQINSPPFPNTAIALFDAEGTILASMPQSGPVPLAGENFRDSAQFQWLRSAEDGATAWLPGVRGVERVWSAVSAPAAWDTGLHITLGVPLTDLTAEVNRTFAFSLGAIALTALAVFGAAWWLAERGIRHSIMRIAGATARFAGGDREARIGKPYPHGELGSLMDRLDRTADRMRDQMEEIDRLNTGLERRVAERTAELDVAKNQAQAADRIKSAFLATMSHELRTPLNSIIGFTGILLQGLAGALNAEQQKQLGMVQGSARHLLALINDVLDISKIEAGQLEVGHAPFDLRASIDKVTGIVRPLAEAKGLALQLALDAGLGKAVGDARRVEQVLLNLLSNAIKFTERGSVTLASELIEDFRGDAASEPQAAVRLRVSDTGMGVKSEDLAKLFQPFRQLDSALSRAHEGTGLGLAICRRLAELMGGSITAESQWQRGSVFTFILPLGREGQDVRREAG